MKLLRPAALLAASLCLAACRTSSTVSVVPLPLPPPRIPPSLTQPCRPVADVPPRDLTMPEAVRLWGRDRQALGECGARHDALAGAVRAAGS